MQTLRKTALTTLLAQKNAEILKINKEILQNSLDKNEADRTLLDAKYDNAKTTKEKNALLDDKIDTYMSNKNTYKNYYNDAKKELSSAKSKVSSVLGVIPSKVSGRSSFLIFYYTSFKQITT